VKKQRARITAIDTSEATIAVAKHLSSAFQRFFDSEKASGLVLIACTVFSLLLTNTSHGAGYLAFWQVHVAGLSLSHWTNDALMAIFFLLIGLELERELYSGELASLKNALLPLVAALGGIATPALIHFALNAGTPSQAGLGIPMATDIAFALGALALLGARVPASLKVFVVAFAVIDDLCAIVVIAVFYSTGLSFAYLGAALAVWLLLVAMNRLLRWMALLPYLLGGALMWFLLLKSGVHATLAGVLLAFAIPYSVKDGDQESPSHRLEEFLHKPVAFVILPIFALANTAIPIAGNWLQELGSSNSLGIMLGLLLGKPLGVTLVCFLAVAVGLCRLPPDLNWRHIAGAGLLGGIGFTMSIFISNLAFAGAAPLIDASKIAVLLASSLAGLLGFFWLRAFSAHAETGRRVRAG
jgi:NhaA family Na+:H+ antiporter